MLSDRLPPGTCVVAEQTVAQAVQSLGLGSLEGVLPVVNNRLVGWDYVLRAGDELHLVQGISGG